MTNSTAIEPHRRDCRPRQPRQEAAAHRRLQDRQRPDDRPVGRVALRPRFRQPAKGYHAALLLLLHLCKGDWQPK